MSIENLEYDFRSRRLALGLDFVDAEREAELAYPVRVEVEWQSPHRTPLPRNQYDFSQLGIAVHGLMRSSSGRYSLSYFPTIREQVDVRIHDYGRRYIPRRLRVPLRTLAEVEAIEAAESTDYLEGRMRTITLFPGAAYYHSSCATGLRGRVVRDGEPMRWAFVEARLPDGGATVARTRGDDRGEFLLLLSPDAVPGSELNPTLDIEVSIAGPAAPPVPPSPALPEQDSLWDLPLEELPPFNVADNVSNGESVPPGYVTALSTVRTVQFIVGRVLTGRDEEDFDFVMP